MVKHAFGYFFSTFVTSLTLSGPAVAVAEDPVIADEGVSISREEFAEILSQTPSRMLEDAANDLGDRYALINQVMVDKRLAAEAEELTSTDDGYWSLQLKLNAVKRDFMLKRHLQEYEAPPLEPLVLERYQTQKEKYARIPETRASSHILLASPPGLDRTQLREKAAEILEELREGADFEEYVAMYSEDSGSRERGGSLDRWLRFGDPEITPPYTEALFSIENVGEYSEVTDSQFGLHIIRLDGIRKAGFEPLEKVRPAIVADLVKEYRALARKAVRARYDLSEEAFVDGEAMEELFAPYMR